MSKKQQQVFVYNKTRETFLSFRVKVSDSVVGRLVGLLGRRSLPLDSGVWIVPGNAVHTIGMMFSFDLVLIDRSFKVVGLRELVRPFTITRPNFCAESVLELPSHSIFCSRKARLTPRKIHGCINSLVTVGRLRPSATDAAKFRADPKDSETNSNP